MAIGNGLPPAEPTISIEVQLEYSPKSHLYSEGMEELGASYELPTYDEEEESNIAEDDSLSITDINKKLTPEN